MAVEPHVFEAGVVVPPVEAAACGAATASATTGVVHAAALAFG